MEPGKGSGFVRPRNIRRSISFDVSLEAKQRATHSAGSVGFHPGVEAGRHDHPNRGMIQQAFLPNLTERAHFHLGPYPYHA